MSFNNKNGVQASVPPFANNSWGTFSSRYDRQANYKNPGKNPILNNDDQTNYANDTNTQNQRDDDYAMNDDSGSFEPNQGSNCDDYGFNDGGYGNQNTNGNNRYSQNSKNFRPKNNQFGSNNFGSQRNQFNSNNFDSQQDQSNSQNFESQQNQLDSNNFGYRQNQSNTNNFGSRPRQFNSNNMNSKNQNRGGSWQSGAGFGRKGNNKGNFPNSFKPNMLDSNQNNAYGDNNSNYTSFKNFRQHFDNREDNKSGINEQGPAPTLFMGRNASYPNELNNLMNPFFCGVCNSRLNSVKSANIHYESKAHDKHISNWLKTTFGEKGMAAPEVKRFVTKEAAGPYNCELCKLDLTSAQHALQHYNGKRHRQAATKISPPTGIGYYNVDGKWVETGKVMDKVTGKEASYILVSTPSGFEPVVLFVAPKPVAGVKRSAEVNKSEEIAPKKSNLGEPQNSKNEKIKEKKEGEYRAMVTDYEKNKQQQKINLTTNNQFKTISLDSQDSSSTVQTVQDALDSQQCKVCGIATTSHDQMMLHLKGIRHTKKLRALGEPPISDLFEKSPTTILESLNDNNPSDVSMYRTPSGSYYCKTCNAALEDVARIKKHISSKAHLAAVKSEENPAPSVS